MALHRRLIALAAADPVREVCGLLLGTNDMVEAVVEARNVAVDPARTFEIDPHVQIEAIRAARTGAPAVIGCYHSHPGGVAQPSSRDLDMARPGSLWLIIAGNVVTAWGRGEAAFERVCLDVA